MLRNVMRLVPRRAIATGARVPEVAEVHVVRNGAIEATSTDALFKGKKVGQMGRGAC